LPNKFTFFEIALLLYHFKMKNINFSGCDQSNMIYDSSQFDQSLFPAATNAGINVQEIYNKYKRKNNVKMDNTKQIASNELRDMRFSSSTAIDTQKNTKSSHEEKSFTESDKLDALIICQRCNGYGFVQKIYNHQVHEITCDVCDSEGLVMKKNPDKKSSNISFRKPISEEKDETNLLQNSKNEEFLPPEIF